MQYWDGTNWVMVPVGKNNETLKSCEGVPTWVVAICPGFTLGGTGPAGGKVVKLLNGTGSHGIEMTKVIEVNGSFSWGCNGTYISGTSVAFGTGQANTNAILAGCTEPNIAAKIADDYSLNGFDNWYLPSKDELDLFNGTYGSDAWSSSEISADKAWVFSQGSWRDNAPKSFSYSIFVVRNY
jgi:hypothetical protein